MPDSKQWMTEKSPRRSKSKNNTNSRQSLHATEDNPSGTQHTRSESHDPSRDQHTRDRRVSRDQQGGNEDIISVEIKTPSTTEHKSRKERKSRKSNALPPLEKRKEKHRKKAKSWPDRDPGELEDEEPKTGKFMFIK